MLSVGLKTKKLEYVNQNLGFFSKTEAGGSTRRKCSIILRCQGSSQLDLNFKRLMNCWALRRLRDHVASKLLETVLVEDQP